MSVRCKCGECRTCRHRVYMRGWRERNPERVRAQNQDYYRRHAASWSARQDPERRRARKLVYSAVRDGRLTKGPCEVGEGCAGSVHAHHDDYSKPLAVRWLCARHHSLIHRTSGERP